MMNLISDLFFVKVAYADFDTFLAKVNEHILNPIIYLFFALAFVVFTYGVVKFLASQTNETARTDGKKHMIFGIIGLTIMFSVWTFINLLISTFDIKGVDPDNPNVSNQVNLNDIDFDFQDVGP